MHRHVVSTDRAPAAIGPYSQAIVANGLVFCSGQIPLDPQTGQLVDSGDVATQTCRVIDNLDAVLRASGSSLGQVIKTTIYLVDMADFGQVNDAYGRYFSSEPPARATVAVAGLPKGARVEIEAIALAGG